MSLEFVELAKKIWMVHLAENFSPRSSLKRGVAKVCQAC